MTENDSFERLRRVASNQQEWRALDATSKVALLKEMLDNIQEISFDGYTKTSQDSVKNVMGLSLDTLEGQLEVATQTLILIAMIKGAMEKYHYAYQVLAGMQKPLTLPTHKAADNQVVVQVAPLTSADKFGPFSKCVGQLYLDPSFIVDEKDVKSFDFDYFDESSESGGVTLILGAGNQTFLTFLDTLHALFQCNRVAYVKHHPLRGNLNGIFRRIFAPLIVRHYLDTEIDIGVEHSRQLVYSPYVTRVHMTGGKATHDEIVWSSSSLSSARKKPVLKATITSELGSITPWIIVPGEYTKQQLHHQASCIVKAVYMNASSNCNSPKVLLISEEWPQREEFMSMIRNEWESHPLPCAWYPGAKKRWEAYRREYPAAEVVESLAVVDDRRLSTPLLGKDGPLTLPLLWIEVNVDMSTEKGCQAAAKEYCFSKEPFAPVLTFAIIRGDAFLESAVQMSNECIFGSLSCSITVPSSLEGSKDVEQAISTLEYGSIGVNAWTGLAYAIMPLTWGAFPGERLDAVESGIGQVKNTYYVPHVQKSVLRTPLVDKIHGEMEHDLRQSTREVESTARFLLNPGVESFIKLIAASMGFHLPSISNLLGREQHKGGSVLTYWIVGLLGIAAIVLHLKGQQIEKQ